MAHHIDSLDGCLEFDSYLWIASAYLGIEPVAAREFGIDPDAEVAVGWGFDKPAIVKLGVGCWEQNHTPIDCIALAVVVAEARVEIAVVVDKLPG